MEELPEAAKVVEEAVVEELQDRALQYLALASFFLDLPSVAGIQSVADGLANELVEGTDSPGLRLLVDFFEGTVVDELLVDKIGADRTFLVRGITKRGPRPPYGLLHAGSDPAVSMVKLKQRYREAGFVFGKDTGEAPDYLGVMLAFMASVLGRAAENPEERAALVRAGDEFLQLYVEPTTRSFSEEALDAAETGYCLGMLTLLDEFIAAEVAEAEERKRLRS